MRYMITSIFSLLFISKAMGIEVTDLRPDIFQMVCGYFSLFMNHYLFPASFRHDLSQSLGMMGVYIMMHSIVVVTGKAKARERLRKKSFKLSPSLPAISHSPDLK